MRISVEREKLVKTLTMLSKIVKKNNIIQPLEGIIISYMSKENIEIKGSNLRTSISTVVDALVEGEETFIVPLKSLLEVLKRLSHKSVVFKFSDGKLLMNSEKLSYTFGTYNPSEYPDIVWKITGEKLTVPSEAFLNAVNETYFAAIPNTEYAPSYSQGIQFEVKGGNFSIVASDGQRLAISRFEVNTAERDMHGMIPATSVSEIIPIISSAELVDLIIGEKHILFSVPEFSAVVTKLNMRIPEYTGVVEKSKDTKNIAVLDRRSFITALERLSYVSAEGYLVKTIFGERMMLESVGTGQGFGTEEIDYSYNGDKISVYLSIRHLLGALKSITSESIRLFVREEMIGIEKVEDQNFIYIVSTASIPEDKLDRE